MLAICAMEMKQFAEAEQLFLRSRDVLRQVAPASEDMAEGRSSSFLIAIKI